MRIFLYSIAVMIAITAFSCGSDDNIIDLKYEISDNTDELTNSRIEYYEDQPISLKSPEQNKTTSDLKSTLKKGSDLSLFAGFDSPVLQGETLSASYMVYKSGYVFVTYHLQGNEYAGALSVYDVRNKKKLRLIEEVIFPNMDINTALISKNNKTLWLGGSNKSGSTIVTITLKSNKIDNNKPIRSKNLNIGASTNGITECKDILFVSVGNSNGGNLVLDIDNNYKILQSFPFSNSKSITFKNPNKFYVLQGGDEANIKYYTVDNGVVNYEESFSCGASIYHQNVPEAYKHFGKNTIFITEGLKECYVAMGANGAKIIDIENGNIIASSPSNMLTTGNTNGISFDHKYIYIANGANGVAIANKLNNGDSEIDLVGIWDDEDYPGSANFVYSHDNFVYVAKGKEGGLKILKINSNDNE